MSDDQPKFNWQYIERREGHIFAETEYRCGDCGELFWSRHASSAIEYCPRCGEAEIEETGLELVGPVEPSGSYKSWRRGKLAERMAGVQGSVGLAIDRSTDETERFELDLWNFAPDKWVTPQEDESYHVTDAEIVGEPGREKLFVEIKRLQGTDSGRSEGGDSADAWRRAI